MEFLCKSQLLPSFNKKIHLKRRTKPKLLFIPTLFTQSSGCSCLLLLLPIHEKPAVQVRQTKKREQQYIIDGHDVQVLASASSSFVQQQQTVVVVVVVFVVVVVVHLAQEKQILPSPNCSVHLYVYTNVRILEDVVSRGPDAEKNIREFVEADVQSKRVFVRDFSSLLEEIFLFERRRGRSE